MCKTTRSQQQSDEGNDTEGAKAKPAPFACVPSKLSLFHTRARPVTFTAIAYLSYFINAILSTKLNKNIQVLSFLN